MVAYACHPSTGEVETDDPKALWVVQFTLLGEFQVLMKDFAQKKQSGQLLRDTPC